MIEGNETRALVEMYGETLAQDSLAFYEGHGPNGDRCIMPETAGEFTELARQFQLWKYDGKTVGIVDGSYDVEQPNHYLYLIQCRTTVAMQRAHEQGNNWGLLSDKEKKRYIESNDVVLVATVDADEKVAELKGKKAEKGGSIRPVYPWDLRAQRVANYTISRNQNDWQQRPVVDVVTSEGKPEHEGTFLESYVEFADFLHGHGLVDTVIMFDQEASHGSTISRLRERGIEPFTIAPHNTYMDERTGESFSSSGIIRIIRGEVEFVQE